MTTNNKLHMPTAQWTHLSDFTFAHTRGAIVNMSRYSLIYYSFGFQVSYNFGKSKKSIKKFLQKKPPLFNRNIEHKFTLFQWLF